VVLVRGENKKKVVAAARQMGSEDRMRQDPARAKGRVVWVIDKDAAG